jgi:hypothetical protein
MTYLLLGASGSSGRRVRPYQRGKFSKRAMARTKKFLAYHYFCANYPYYLLRTKMMRQGNTIVRHAIKPESHSPNMF